MSQSVPLPFGEGVPIPASNPASFGESEHGDSFIEQESFIFEQGVYSSNDPILGEAVRSKAQEVHTARFLKEEFITEDELERGVYTEYASRSTYFLAINGDKDTAVRQIACDKKGGLLSLPTPQNFSLDVSVVKEAAGVGRLADIKPSEIVEISGLASMDKEGASVKESDGVPVLLLYSRMLREALEKGQKHWILNTVPGVATRLKRVIGSEQIHRIGEKQYYMGSETTPYLINPQDVVRTIMSSEDEKLDWRKDFLREIFKGVDNKAIPKDIRTLFAENNVETTSSSRLKEIVKNPKFIATAGLAAYCAARALPAANIEEFDGSVAALWGIDFATIYPYVHGIEQMYKAQSVGKRVLGMAEATSAFSAPYVYLYMEGNDYPSYVNMVVGGLITAGVAKEVYNRISKKRREAVLAEGFERLPASPEQD